MGRGGERGGREGERGEGEGGREGGRKERRGEGGGSFNPRQNRSLEFASCYHRACIIKHTHRCTHTLHILEREPGIVP